jgi:predicted transposase YbfD/YdcC
MQFEDKTYEIKAIPFLWTVLVIKRNNVTMDAIYNRKEITLQFAGKQADYVLSANENQPELPDEITDSSKKFDYRRFSLRL